MSSALAMAMGARDYKELIVWQIARELADRVLTLTSQASLEREYSIVRQLRTSSGSVCANIAEGFGRFLPGDFARFLRIARGSAMEVEQHLHELTVRQLITRTDADELNVLCRRVIAASTGLIRYLESTKFPR